MEMTNTEIEKEWTIDYLRRRNDELFAENMRLRKQLAAYTEENQDRE
jgi:hypothetical protein